MSRDVEPSPELAHQVDDALDALWQGRTDEFDRLLAEGDEADPGLGGLFRGIIPQASSEAGPAPTRIADYEIIGELGRGGMGVVYEAVQQEPKRHVALKIVRGGRLLDDTRIKLFEREVRTLARLQHPSIAAIYEAGRTEDGLHFFAMELVRGVTLTRYARAGGAGEPGGPLSTRATLRLFVKVCDAINYAHQRGVIHRDLKPSNILVTEEAASGSGSRAGLVGDVKVLDFGLARITDADVAVTTITTDSGRIRGTLGYMSPEQARGDPNEIDVRADVYSLGVVLYELLTGRLPHEIHRRSMAEAVRAICEEPPTPPASIERGLRGDLETIILKALEKDPHRRYQSAAALSDDVQRFLASEPILARPPSAIYQLQKLISRHKVPAAALAAVILVSIAGFATSTYLYLQADAARVAEVRQRAVAQQVSGFLTDMLNSVDPRKSPGADITILRKLLDDASTRVETQLADYPQVRGQIETTIAHAYWSLGLYDQAERHADIAVELVRPVLGDEHNETLRALNTRASVLQDRGRLAEAEAIFRNVLETRRRTLGSDHPDTLISANNLGTALESLHKLPEATAAFREAADGRRRVLGPDHPDTVISTVNLGGTLILMGRAPEAEKVIREGLAAQRRILPPDHPDLYTSISDLATSLRAQRKFAEAEPLFREAMEGFRRTVGPGQMDTTITTCNLAGVLLSLDRASDAAALFPKAFEEAQRGLGESHWLTAVMEQTYARVLTANDRTDEAESHLLAALDHLRKSMGEDHRYTQAARADLRQLYEQRGESDRAKQYGSAGAAP